MSAQQPSPRLVAVDVRRLSKWLDGIADRHGPIDAELDGDEVLVTAADESRAWIEVPFPPLAVTAGRVVTSLLLLHAVVPRRVGVLLVRRGGHAAGVFLGRDLITSKVGSSYVQGTTKAGGWSQQRYARRRDNQAKAAFAAPPLIHQRITA